MYKREDLKTLKRVETHRAETKKQALNFVSKKMEENENDPIMMADLSFRVVHKPAKQVKGEEVSEWFEVTITYVYAKE